VNRRLMQGGLVAAVVAAGLLTTPGTAQAGQGSSSKFSSKLSAIKSKVKGKSVYRSDSTDLLEPVSVHAEDVPPLDPYAAAATHAAQGRTTDVKGTGKTGKNKAAEARYGTASKGDAYGPSGDAWYDAPPAYAGPSHSAGSSRAKGHRPEKAAAMPRKPAMRLDVTAHEALTKAREFTGQISVRAFRRRGNVGPFVDSVVYTRTVRGTHSADGDTWTYGGEKGVSEKGVTRISGSALQVILTDGRNSSPRVFLEQ
jgi:hypothetical protein